MPKTVDTRRHCEDCSESTFKHVEVHKGCSASAATLYRCRIVYAEISWRDKIIHTTVCAVQLSSDAV